MRRSRGFTLIELMVVVTLLGVLAAIAAVSVRKATTQNDVDRVAALLRDTITLTARRAALTGQPYLLEVKPTSVQYCQATSSSMTTCVGATVDVGMLQSFARKDATIAFYLNSADVGQSGLGAGKVALSTSALVYFGPNGTTDASYTNVMSRGLATTGFTAYIRRQFTDETTKRRRVIAYPLSSRPRVIDNYN
jgi:type II secretion system protein H